MSIKDILYKKAPPANREKDVEVRFYTDDGGEVYEEDVVAFIKGELERRKEDRRGFELQWRLNSNFLLGHQNCDINPYRSEVEDRDVVHEYIQAS